MASYHPDDEHKVREQAASIGQPCRCRRCSHLLGHHRPGFFQCAGSDVLITSTRRVTILCPKCGFNYFWSFVKR